MKWGGPFLRQTFKDETLPSWNERALRYNLQFFEQCWYLNFRAKCNNLNSQKQRVEHTFALIWIAAATEVTNGILFEVMIDALPPIKYFSRRIVITFLFLSCQEHEHEGRRDVVRDGADGDVAADVDVVGDAEGAFAPDDVKVRFQMSQLE